MRCAQQIGDAVCVQLFHEHAPLFTEMPSSSETKLLAIKGNIVGSYHRRTQGPMGMSVGVIKLINLIFELFLNFNSEIEPVSS
jgi:hypothetical protein